VDLTTADDAAVYRVSDDLAIVLTADFFTPIVDDPYEFGRIAVTNALSDVYAMGGRPVVGLNLVAYPARSRSLDDLEAMLRGGADQAGRAGVAIVGGHSIDDPEPKYGLSVMGFVNPAEVLTNAAAKPGDVLVLTKPLGIGVITTAIKNDAAPAGVIARAVEVMTALNGSASEAARVAGCRACTDITGFGLLGHLREMTSASGVGARISLSRIPVIEGVSELLAADMAPGGSYRNLEFLDNAKAVAWEGSFSGDERLLLADAQTSGGLLIAVAESRARTLIDDLLSGGAMCAAEIGRIVADPNGIVTVVP